MACSSCCRPPPPPSPLLRRRAAPQTSSLPRRFNVLNAYAAASAVSDSFVLQIAGDLEDSSAPSSSPAVDALRASSSRSLLSTQWPNRKSDAFRFTDLSYLRRRPVVPASAKVAAADHVKLESPFPYLLAVVDGQPAPAVALPPGAFAGPLSAAPPGAIRDRLLSAVESGLGFNQKDLFYDFNALGVPDVAAVYIPAGMKLADMPIHVKLVYTAMDAGGDNPMLMSNPRVLVLAEEGAEVAIVEEHCAASAGEKGSCYWANSVVEFVIEEGARVMHSYVQRQSSGAAHIKWTVTQQKTSSTYELVEVSTGGKLSRHNLHIQQLGPDTVTEMSTFHLSSQSKQIHDLHSRLVLDHPRGYSRQLHKCIVSDSGNGIFDGNIKVNRFAQQTDAGQETKCLLLSPQALVNVKPNLQIIADDVKCSHGAAISGELDKNELFYFQARGINLQAAMDALIFSFGAHVIRKIPFKPMMDEVANQVKELLVTSSRQQR